MILEWTLKILGEKLWTGFIWLMIWSSGGSCEHGGETSGSIKGEEFLD
jgi:hypothetical protein